MRFALLLSFAALFATSPVFAQERKKEDQNKVTASGTIKAVGGGALHVVSTEGDQWIVSLAPKAEVFVRGSATRDFVKPGMLVKFSGKFNKKAETVKPLSSITVYQPRVENKEWQGRGREGEVDDATKDLAAGLFKSDEPVDPKKKGKPAETVDVSSGGQVTSARGGKVSVRGPGVAFKLDLTDDAQVSLDLSDLRTVRAGDKISLEGWNYPNDVTKVVASKVTIQLSETLGEKKTKKPEEK